MPTSWTSFPPTKCDCGEMTLTDRHDLCRRCGCYVSRGVLRRYQVKHNSTKNIQRQLQSARMPIGKFRGFLFVDIPTHYLRWVASQEDFYPSEARRMCIGELGRRGQ